MSNVFQGKIMAGDGDLIATIDNMSYHVTKDHPMYDRLFDAYKDGDADDFVNLVNVKQCMETYVGSTPDKTQTTGLVIDGERVFYDGIELNNSVVETIRNMMYAGLDIQPMLKFLERAIKSNSKRVVDELFKFLQVCKLTITEDGCFLAYKSVRSDYRDKYTGKFDNSVGAENRMPRFNVDDNCAIACSHGFHVGALPYAGPGGYYNSYGDVVLICKIAPEDVISVPLDSSCQKLRTCAYTVVGEFKGELRPTVYSGKVGDDYGKSMEPKRKQRVCEPEDMVVDGVYQAEYNKNGEIDWRYFVVLEVSNDYVIVELVDPESNAGSVRRLNFKKFGLLCEFDGSNFYEYEDGDSDWDDEDEDIDEEDNDDGEDDRYSPW